MQGVQLRVKGVVTGTAQASLNLPLPLAGAQRPQASCWLALLVSVTAQPGAQPPCCGILMNGRPGCGRTSCCPPEPQGTTHIPLAAALISSCVIRAAEGESRTCTAALRRSSCWQHLSSSATRCMAHSSCAEAGLVASIAPLASWLGVSLAAEEHTDVAPVDAPSFEERVLRAALLPDASDRPVLCTGQLGDVTSVALTLCCLGCTHSVE
jgi:hypothetical protein